MIRFSLLLLLLIACGKPAESPTPPVEILPPNVEQSCALAIACAVFAEEQRDACVRCLNEVTVEMIAEIEAQLGYKLPPLEALSCESVTDAVTKYTNISECVAGDWYLRKPGDAF